MPMPTTTTSCRIGKLRETPQNGFVCANALPTNIYNASLSALCVAIPLTILLAFAVRSCQSPSKSIPKVTLISNNVDFPLEYWQTANEHPGIEPLTRPTMRLSHLLCALISTQTTALQLPDFQSFVSAISITLEDYLPPALLSNETATERHDILKRQFSNTCPNNFGSCANLGAPGLCCANDAICSADAAGHVACCPSGAACSGTIGGVITQGTVNSIGSLITGTTGTGTATSSFVFATTSTSGGLVIASVPTVTSQGAGQYNPSTSGNGFVIAGSSTVATPGAAVRGAQIVSPRWHGQW